MLNGLSQPDIVKEWRSEDGASWYKKHKSGFIEQSGIYSSANVTLLIPFKKETYHADYSAGGYSYAGVNGVISDRTKTSFKLIYINFGINRWYACGY